MPSFLESEAVSSATGRDTGTDAGPGMGRRARDLTRDTTKAVRLGRVFCGIIEEKKEGEIERGDDEYCKD